MQIGNTQMEKKQKADRASKGSRYREVLTAVVNNPPETILLGGWDEKGDLTFSIAMTDIGLEYKDYGDYEDVFFTYFVVDFVGELLVRENIDLFVEKLKNVNVKAYEKSVEDFGIHKRFGLRTDRGRLVFKFHMSFLSNILTDNLREVLGNSENNEKE